VHIIAKIRRNEVVIGDSVVTESRVQLRKRSDVADTVGRVWVLVVGHIREKELRCMFWRKSIGECIPH